MRNFREFYCNGKYKVGLSGTVWVYDMKDQLIGRFTETPYTYFGIFVPGTDIFVTHTNECHLVVYDLSEMKMLKKIKTSNCDCDESAGLAFSPDGKLLYCVQADWNTQLKTRLVVYDTDSFKVTAEYFAGQDRFVVKYIEIENDGTCYVCGWDRDVKTGNDGFVGIFRDGELIEPKIFEEDWMTVFSYFDWKLSGYTNKAFQFMPGKRNLDQEKIRGITLKGLYETGRL